MSGKSTFGGFDAIGDMLLNPDSEFKNVIPNDEGPGDDPVVPNPPAGDDDDDDIDDPSSVNNDSDTDDGTDGDTDGSDDDDDDTEQNDPANTDSDNDDNSDDNVDTLGDFEPEIAGYVQEKLYEKFGWSKEEDDSSFSSVDDVVEFLNKVVEQNSKPQFANTELAQLNDFVANGGNIESYLQQKYTGNVDLDKLDIEDSSNQSMVLREFFKEQGHDSAKIEKRLQRYEDTGIKEDEAREAFDMLKKSRKEKSDKLLVSQEKEKKLLLEQQQKFYNDVTSVIKDTKDIRGIPVAAATRKKLAEYIFKADNDGKTAYQRDYESSAKNLIESAFFTMEGDTLISKMNKQASSKAAKTLKDKLETKTKRGRNNARYDDNADKGDFSLFSKIGHSLGKPQF